MQHIEIHSEPVELYKLLKFEGLAASGGEAKALVAAGEVQVNKAVETRKRKKIVAGDIVTFNGCDYHIVLTAPQQ
ncbi:MAG: RNA-binding S4 domain-containing protein [Pseudomonadota bacterium]